MKRLILSVAFSAIEIGCAYSGSVQEVVPPEGYEFADSLVYRRADVADTTLLGRDILDIMPSRAKGDKAQVSVNQSDAIVSSLHEYVSANASREIVGYRVRIFFDNHRTARAESEAALKKFNGIYHDVPSYRTYVNPYFKVTVGDYRTKSEAMALLERIKGDFPSAFVVKETITFPVVDKENAFYVDTVKVLRPLL